MVATAMTLALDACARTAVAASPRQSGGDVRVGVDVVLRSDVQASIDTFGASYLRRIYTSREVADCTDAAGVVDASRLAARFAVKEAVTKVLAPSDAPGWWRDIETVRAASGACELRLHGNAAAHAGRLTLSGWSVSLTHEGDYSAAVVVATPHQAQEAEA